MNGLMREELRTRRGPAQGAVRPRPLPRALLCWVALGWALLCLAGGLLIVAPGPSQPLYFAGVVLTECSLVVTAAGGVGLGVAALAGHAGRRRRPSPTSALTPPRCGGWICGSSQRAPVRGAGGIPPSCSSMVAGGTRAAGAAACFRDGSLAAGMWSSISTTGLPRPPARAGSRRPGTSNARSDGSTTTLRASGSTPNASPCSDRRPVAIWPAGRLQHLRAGFAGELPDQRRRRDGGRGVVPRERPGRLVPCADTMVGPVVRHPGRWLRGSSAARPPRSRTATRSRPRSPMSTTVRLQPISPTAPATPSYRSASRSG